MPDDMNHNSDTQRIAVYPDTLAASSKFEQWKTDSGNGAYRFSFMTVFAVLILLLYSGSNLAVSDPTAWLKDLNQGMVIFVLVTTVVSQWIIFFIMFAAAYRERTGLYGLGFKRLRFFDLILGLVLFAAAAATMAGLARVMELLGYPLPGEIAMLIPKDAFGRVVWVFVSLTAGICEEALFRGYLMTRLRILLKSDSWFWPLIISSVIFGAAHGYQGPHGMILLSVYGIILGSIFIYTKSLWPVIVVHALQDLLALFIPQ